MIAFNKVNKEEIKNYLKENLKIDIEYGFLEKYITLKLEGETISKVQMPIF